MEMSPFLLESKLKKKIFEDAVSLYKITTKSSMNIKIYNDFPIQATNSNSNYVISQVINLETRF